MNESYILSNNHEIYPLIKYKYNNKEYLFYTENRMDKIKSDDIIVAEMVNDELIPVDEELLKEFESVIEKILHKELD